MGYFLGMCNKAKLNSTPYRPSKLAFFLLTPILYVYFISSQARLSACLAANFERWRNDLLEWLLLLEDEIKTESFYSREIIEDVFSSPAIPSPRFSVICTLLPPNFCCYMLVRKPGIVINEWFCQFSCFGILKANIFLNSYVDTLSKVNL